MADNKFIERLKGKETEKSVLEIKNQATKLSFANMPQGTSNAIDVFSDHRGDATAVLNGTTNWKISNADLLLADTVSGDGEDFLSTYSVSGAGLWVNSTYTFPSTGDPKHPIAMIFNPSTKWVLKVCGDNLIVDGGSTIDFTMLIKIGTANIYSKNFTVRESAGQFSKEFVIDFGEANSDIVKAGGLSTLTVQLLCGTANASARIYNGMSVLTCLQRKVDASAVSNNGGNVEDVLNGNMVPADYFSNPEFIDQIEDGKDAYAVFTRDGDNVDLSGWTSKDKFIVKSNIIPEASTVPVGSVYMYMGETNTEFVHGYIYQNVKQDDLVVWERMDVQPNNGGGGNVDSVNGKTGVVVLTGEDIAADVSELTDTVQGHLQTLHDSIKDIELFKFPNAIIIGEPIIDHGQISGFTANDYLQFPFIVDLHNQPFQIDFCFTTGEDVTTQQNILDSQFGLALAIRNGKGVMAISHNGTSWVAEIVGTRNILPNTTYYARLSWNRINYKTELSTDGITYVSDMNFGSTQSPYPRTMFIGGCSGSAIGHTPHPFKGTINLNYAYLTVSGNVIWQGMDDAGLATRADISLDNLDEFGQAKFDAKQNKLVAGQNIVIDETTNTISATGDGETIKNQNASSSIEKTYDWTGTLQHAINQNVRALHPDWKIFITDDVAGGESVYTKSQVDTALNNKANKATTLSGYGITNAYTKTESDDKFINTGTISNCITEIPQDIELETVSDGTTRIKAGSKVYIPNGPGVFNTVTIPRNITIAFMGSVSAYLQYAVFVKQDGSDTYTEVLSSCYSGATAPSVLGISYWYDTTNNVMRYSSGGTTWTNINCSLPVAILTVLNGKVKSIDQVFNGFGYIGKTFFVLPGVKLLHANGRNADNTLKSDKVTVQNVLTHTTNAADYISRQLIVSANGTSCQIAAGTGNWFYDREKNYFIYLTNGDRGWVDVGYCVAGDLHTLKTFTPKLGFQVTDYSEFATRRLVNYQLPAGNNSYTWYRKYADGWVEQGGRVVITLQAFGTNVFWQATFPIPMANEYYFATSSILSGWINSTNGGIEVKSATGMTGYIGTTSGTVPRTISVYWQVAGVAA